MISQQLSFISRMSTLLRENNRHKLLTACPSKTIFKYMKKLFIVFSIIVLPLFVTESVFAQGQSTEITTVPTSADKQLTVTPSPVIPIKTYQLAFPGLLPDNPLYKLKLLRDKITAFFIKDPQKKVAFYLLQTDKGIAMVPMLVDKKELELAKTTALKAENYYTMIMFVYKGNGTKPDSKTYQKLLQAADMHQQVLVGLLPKLKDNDKKVIEQVINFSKTNVNELKKIYKDGKRKQT